MEVELGLERWDVPSYWGCGSLYLHLHLQMYGRKLKYLKFEYLKISEKKNYYLSTFQYLSIDPGMFT